MIFFIYFLGNILLILSVISIFASYSKIKFIIIDFKITDYDDLKAIIKSIKDKDFLNVFDYLDFILKLELHLLNKIPIINFKISDEKIKNILIRQIRKRKLKKEEKALKKFEKKDKKEIDNDLLDISIEKLDLLINLGTDNASLTAFSTTAINILLSLVLLFFAENKQPDNYIYSVNPVYIDKNIFNINASLVLSIPASDIVKLIR